MSSITAERAEVFRAPPRSFMSPVAAAAYATVSPGTILRWCTQGILKGRKVGGRWRVDPKDLDRLLGEDNL